MSTENLNNVTKPTLTGIPQVDYIWDPNLPKELNGYNLSEYPFYERVPEDIDFKCDGLHDGFYASVPHKCQVFIKIDNTDFCNQLSNAWRFLNYEIGASLSLDSDLFFLLIMSVIQSTIVTKFDLAFLTSI